MSQPVRPSGGGPVPPEGNGPAGNPAPEKHLNVRQAAFIGVGAMVGAGIFALLGAAGEVAGSAVWLSFLIAGIIAGLQGYSSTSPPPSSRCWAFSCSALAWTTAGNGPGPAVPDLSGSCISSWEHR
jgi:amino acid transporter